MVNEDAALLNRHVTHMTPPHFSAAVYTSSLHGRISLNIPFVDFVARHDQPRADGYAVRMFQDTVDDRPVRKLETNEVTRPGGQRGYIPRWPSSWPS